MTPKGMRLVVRLHYVDGRWKAELSCGHRWETDRRTLEGSYLFCGLCRMHSFRRERGW
jgi:hypothetical protein